MPIGAVGLIRSIRMQLGEDRNYGVEVECSDAQIAHCIRIALQEYSRHFPVRSHQSFICPAGQYLYKPDPAIRGVVELSMLQDQEAQLSSPEVALLGGRITTLGASFQFSSPYAWHTYKVWKDMTETVMSAKPSWLFNPEDGYIYLYNPITTHKVTFVGVLDFEVGFGEEDSTEKSADPADTTPSTPVYALLDVALRTVPERKFSMVRELALAKTKETLGYMRRKYSSIPGADRDIQLDGVALVQEGKQEWDAIVSDLRKRSTLVVPQVG